MHSSRRMAAGAVRSEVWLTFVVQDGFGHDGARGVSGAQKQNVVMFWHKGSVPSSAAGGSTTRSRRFYRADEATEELSVDLRGVEIHGNLLARQKFQRVFGAVDACGLNINLLESSSGQLGAVFFLFQRAGNASHPGEHALANLRQHLATGDHVGYGETASGFEHAEGFVQDFAFVGREIDHAVRDDDVD